MRNAYKILVRKPEEKSTLRGSLYPTEYWCDLKRYSGAK